MDLAILDTDILSEVLKQQNARVTNQATPYLKLHVLFASSSIIRYEVRRGLKDKNAQVQLARFAVFCRQSLIIAVADSILDRAADLWVLGRKLARPHRDADLIIAATALEHGRSLVSGNTPHFAWIPGLKLENWR